MCEAVGPGLAVNSHILCCTETVLQVVSPPMEVTNWK